MLPLATTLRHDFRKLEFDYGQLPLIALIEDEEHLAQGLLFNLEAEGYRTHHEADGDAALHGCWPRRRPVGIPIRLQSCAGLHAAGADGFAIARALREAQRYTPILMLTARSRQEDILKGLEAGADDYLPKPFDLSILLVRIKVAAAADSVGSAHAEGHNRRRRGAARAGDGGRGERYV